MIVTVRAVAFERAGDARVYLEAFRQLGSFHGWTADAAPIVEALVVTQSRSKCSFSSVFVIPGSLQWVLLIFGYVWFSFLLATD